MDRKLLVIVVICCIEVAFRAAYDLLRVDPLLYTFLVRAIEMLIIFSLAFKDCGLIASSISKELLIGLFLSAVFAAAVVSADLASRLFVSGGVLKPLIGKQHITNIVGFITVGCVFGPFVEELFFRGLFYAWLRQRMHVIAAIFLSALIFASMHGFISVVQLIGGLLFAGIYEWRQNIWAPYTVHVLANIGIWVFPWIYPF